MVQSNTESRNQSKEPVTENEDGDLGWARLRRPLCLAGHFTFYPVGSRESLGIWRNDMVLIACWEGNLAACGRRTCTTRDRDTSKEADKIELMREDENLNLGRSGSHAWKSEIQTVGEEYWNGLACGVQKNIAGNLGFQPGQQNG